MIIIIFIALIIVVTTLGVVVFLNRHKNILNNVFLIFIALVDFWILTNLLSYTPFDKLALLGAQLGIVGPAWIPSFLLIFSYIFCNGLEKYKKKRKYFLLSFLPSIVITLFTFTSYNVKSFEITSGGNFFTPGSLYYYFIIYFVITFILVFSYLVKSYRKNTGLVRLQSLYIIYSLIFTIVIGLLFTAILPFLGVKKTTFVGPFSTVFMIIFTSYAILKYRLMDIKVIIKRSTVFAFLVIIITSIFTLFSYIISQLVLDATGMKSLVLNGVIMAVIISIGFEPLKKLLSEATDSFLFKAEYDPQEVISDYSEKFSTTLYIEELTQFISEKSFQVFRCSFASLFLKNRESGTYEEEYIVGEVGEEKMKLIDQKLFKKIYNYLEKIHKVKDIIVKEEFKKLNERLGNRTLNQFLNILDKEGVNLVIPMFVKEELVGILFMGDKKSGDVYSQSDLSVLEIMASQAAVAIKNAQLYEEQRMFAEHLKKEVEKATEDLQVANEKLVKLDEAKSEFISIASHQLRTPLTVVKGYISMILEGNFGEVNYAVTDSLDKVYESNERLIQLVENLLNISRIESGRLQFNYEVIYLEDLVDSVAEELQGIAKKKGLKFTYKKPKKKMLRVKLDQEKIRQVILNLIDNSIKYTQKGSVTVALKKTGDNVEFCVSDSGMGIKPDDLPNLFKKFIRGTGSPLIHTEGTGLGLYVADQMIKAHNGKVWAESRGEGMGAKFCFVLPKYKHSENLKSKNPSNLAGKQNAK